jgi:hypothetical protein
MRITHALVIAMSIGVGSMLSGCSTLTGGIDESKVKGMPVESIVASADKAAAAGNHERALALLDAGAKVYPAAPQPWLKKAQMYFKAENYPSAILAAEEAIRRDPVNEEAKSVALVSSLRIAVKYVSDLRALNDVKGDIKPDAEQLARRLRDTLNATVLVPTGGNAVAARPAPVRSRPAPTYHRRHVETHRSAPVAPPAPQPPPEPSNPFSSLQ